MIHLLFTLKRIKFIINILSGLPSIKLFQCGVPFCSVFNLNNKNVNALIAGELSGFTCTRSLKMNSKFSINFSFIVSEFVLVNPDNLLAECVNL